MIVPKPEFRPNPDRAIYVQGVIDLSLVQNLTPQIISLQHQSREPITVYIDSPGGSVYYMFALLRLLKASTQDFEKSHLITVATHHAASAAADLLSAGSYALAYPNSRVLFHGGRLAENELTAERTTILAQYLRLSNESSAMELAREVEYRFMFRFISSRGRFSEIRNRESKPQMSDLDCFLDYISQHLSDTARGILEIAQERYGRYDELLATVYKKTSKLSENKTPLEIEAAQIKAIVDFEVGQNRKTADWSFHAGGVNGLVDDFLLFREYQNISQSDRFINWCSALGSFLVTPEEANEIKKIPNAGEQARKWAEKTSPMLQPIWSFFVALCYTLQRGENDYLTARDAYWLGLIDEVIGDESLLPFRLMQEDVDEPKEEEAKDKPKSKRK